MEKNAPFVIQGLMNMGFVPVVLAVINPFSDQ